MYEIPVYTHIVYMQGVNTTIHQLESYVTIHFNQELDLLRSKIAKHVSHVWL